MGNMAKTTFMRQGQVLLK